jgi:dTDP-4-dehydrorhamnose 3,5-epimerase
MAFQFKQLAIPDVWLITTQQWKDSRGFFMETYKATSFSEHALPTSFAQDNCAYSTYGALRGLHYQKNPRAQGKLVMTLRGTIFDVAVDIRQESPTYGQWVGQELSDENQCMLYVPPGFAHGYCVLSKEALIVYKVTHEYAPEADRGIVWSDPEIDVEWPITAPTISQRDKALPLLRDADNNFTYSPKSLQ